MGARERLPVGREDAPIRGFEGIRRTLSRRRARRQQRESHANERDDETTDVMDKRFETTLISIRVRKILRPVANSNFFRNQPHF